MDILKVLRKEESKLIRQSEDLHKQLAGIRIAIKALAGHSNGIRKSRFSAEARARMAAAQKKRWAKVKKAVLPGILFYDLPQPNRRRLLMPIIDNQFHVVILLRDGADRGFDLSTVA